MSWSDAERDRCSLRCGDHGDPPCLSVREDCDPCRHCRDTIPRALRPLPPQRQSAGPLFNQEDKAK
jgi:hypothetical protein